MKKPFLFAGIIYLFGAAILFPYVRWYADNPDTFQYLSIASKYSSGDFYHAVNGYWSPMISWLLTVPLLFFKDQLLVFKIIQLLIGLFTLWQWYKLLLKTTIENSWKNILLFTLIPFLLDYALLNATPDLFFMGLILMLLNFLIEGNLDSSKTKAVKIGITGAVLFFTKAFGFPFFIAITLIIIFVELFTSNGKKYLWKNIFILYGIFFLISSIWITTLSLHYGYITISEAASFNLSRDVVPLPERSAGLPILDKGLNQPPAHSYTAWESPGEYVSREIVTPFNSTSDYLQIVKRNLLSIYYFDFRHQSGVFFPILFLLFLILRGRKELFNQRWLLICILSVILLYKGYSLILVHSRYTWLNNLLMLMMSVYFIQSILNKNIFRVLSGIAIVFLLLLSLKRPLKEILYTTDKDYPVSWFFHSLKNPFYTLWIFYKPDFTLKNISIDIKEKNIINGNIASIKDERLERDSYTNALRITQNSNCRYFGQLDNLESLDQQKEELSKMNVDYLITWNNTKWGDNVPVYYNPAAGVYVYSFKK